MYVVAFGYAVLAAVAAEAGRRGERIPGFADMVTKERENMLKGGEDDEFRA